MRWRRNCALPLAGSDQAELARPRNRLGPPVCDQRSNELDAVQVPGLSAGMCSFVAASTVVDAFGITVPLPPGSFRVPVGRSLTACL